MRTIHGLISPWAESQWGRGIFFIKGGNTMKIRSFKQRDWTAAVSAVSRCDWRRSSGQRQRSGQLTLVSLRLTPVGTRRVVQCDKTVTALLTWQLQANVCGFFLSPCLCFHLCIHPVVEASGNFHPSICSHSSGSLSSALSAVDHL